MHQGKVRNILERKLQGFVHFPDSSEEQYLREEYERRSSSG